jgi:hypothetical protein
MTEYWSFRVIARTWHGEGDARKRAREGLGKTSDVHRSDCDRRIRGIDREGTDGPLDASTRRPNARSCESVAL